MSRILVTGATGYVGGRLVPRLLDAGHDLRLLVRSPRKLDHVTWHTEVEIIKGEVGDLPHPAMDNIDAAVYLVHGIGDGPRWAAKEVRDAEHFRSAAVAAGVQRIIYLGGMGNDGTALSEHLSSRHAVGRTLAGGPIAVTELRAAVIIGSGSASFEMLRYLVEVLPIMVTPKWVATRTQPIAISDVLTYLMRAIEAPEPYKGVFEIGGPDVVSYAQLMAIYAQQAGLKPRRLIPVPFLTPRLSSHWVGLVTPVPASLARPLVNSLVNEVVVTDEASIGIFGPPERTLKVAIDLALGRTLDGDVPTAFTAADLQQFHPYITDPNWAGGTELINERSTTSSASSENIFAAITSLGGSKRWHSGDWLWKVRGIIDLVWGGPGLRRGRRDDKDLVVGDYVDFWRVEELRADELVRLHAEMILPGDAWLEWTIKITPSGTQLTQRARFKPRGLWGRCYWYLVLPFHVFIFPGLLRGIIADAEKQLEKG